MAQAFAICHYCGSPATRPRIIINTDDETTELWGNHCNCGNTHYIKVNDVSMTLNQYWTHLGGPPVAGVLIEVFLRTGKNLTLERVIFSPSTLQ